MKLRLLLSLVFLLGSTAQASVCDNRKTDLSLVLTIDVSGSIDADEVRTQIEGYQKAVSQKGVVNNLLHCQCTAIGVVLWASTQQVAFPLQRMESENEIAALQTFFSDLLERSHASDELGLSYTTELVDALQFSRDYLITQKDLSHDLMILVSGDGYDSRMMATLERVRELRTLNEQDGIVVNGLPLDIYQAESDFADPLNSEVGPEASTSSFVSPYRTVSDYYEKEVITSSGAVDVSTSFAELEAALTRSLLRNTCQLMM